MFGLMKTDIPLSRVIKYTRSVEDDDSAVTVSQQGHLLDLSDLNKDAEEGTVNTFLRISEGEQSVDLSYDQLRELMSSE